MFQRQPWNGQTIWLPRKLPRTLAQLRRAVAAHVVERLDRAGPAVAHDEDRLVDDLVLDEVARLRDLLEPARHLPHVRPEALSLYPKNSWS